MELAIDSVGPQASVAVSDAGRSRVEITWPAGRRHTPSLMPVIDHAVCMAGVTPDALAAVFVDAGPGAYGGIRAGMAAAKAMAWSLTLPVVGVGRLEIEAYAHAAAAVPILALHQAGRAQWVWALYEGPAVAWKEACAPALSGAEDLLALLERLPAPGVLCGDLDALPPPILDGAPAAGWTLAGAAASMRRAALLAELGWRRLQAGGGVPPEAVQPLYMRPPAIGPQPPPPEQAPRPREEHG